MFSLVSVILFRGGGGIGGEQPVLVLSREGVSTLTKWPTCPSQLGMVCGRVGYPTTDPTPLARSGLGGVGGSAYSAYWTTGQ